MAEQHEDILDVTNPITVDETAGDLPEDDEIAVSANRTAQSAALFGSDPVFDFAEPANLSRKAGLSHGESTSFSSVFSLEEAGNV
ncbi:hypothetical protein BOX17_03685 [Halomonas aestuarii]|uniref:Uncharacterized protein n=1 Tax=Halomonas aestuarii TaxID=1897729 RepID=A0A1J0VDL8_9GAMM|nr:hypothetical protein [Halomonas aestuarii]APE30131.1 hypothetical protein BOX17_03685 [Halomonas aestuarii]